LSFNTVHNADSKLSKGNALLEISHSWMSDAQRSCPSPARCKTRAGTASKHRLLRCMWRSHFLNAMSITQQSVTTVGNSSLALLLIYWDWHSVWSIFSISERTCLLAWEVGPPRCVISPRPLYVWCLLASVIKLPLALVGTS
jgi:hypothetical protein